MGGMTAARAIAAIAACLVLWRTGLLQATVMLPVTVVRGVLSPLKPAQDGVEPFSIAGGVLNVTKDHMQVVQNLTTFTIAAYLRHACRRTMIPYRSP